MSCEQSDLLSLLSLRRLSPLSSSSSSPVLISSEGMSFCMCWKKKKLWSGFKRYGQRAPLLYVFLKIWKIPHRQLFGQFADHAVQVVCQALELLVSWLKKVRTSPGQEPEGTPAVVRVPHNPVMIYRSYQESDTNTQETEKKALTGQLKNREKAPSYLYSSSTMLAGSACSMASAKNSSSDGMNSLNKRHHMFKKPQTDLCMQSVHWSMNIEDVSAGAKGTF